MVHGRVLDAVSVKCVGCCSQRSVSRLLSSWRLRSLAFPLPSYPHCRSRHASEGGREEEEEGGRGMVHASTPAAAAAYAPSITNVNSQDGSLSHWLRLVFARSWPFWGTRVLSFWQNKLESILPLIVKPLNLGQNLFLYHGVVIVIHLPLVN